MFIERDKSHTAILYKSIKDWNEIRKIWKREERIEREQSFNDGIKEYNMSSNIVKGKPLFVCMCRTFKYISKDFNSCEELELIVQGL